MSVSAEPSDVADLRRAFAAGAAVECYDQSTGSSDVADLRRAFAAGAAVERYDNKRGSVDKGRIVGIAIAVTVVLAAAPVSAALFAGWPGAGGGHPAERRGVLDRKSAPPSDAGTRPAPTSSTADTGPPLPSAPSTTARAQVPQQPFSTSINSVLPFGSSPPSDAPAQPAAAAPTPSPPPAPPPTAPPTTTPPAPPTTTPPVPPAPPAPPTITLPSLP
jgi:hypothetical protein